VLTLTLGELQRYYDQRVSMSGAASHRSTDLILESLAPDRLVVRLDPNEGDGRPGALWSGMAQLRIIEGIGFMMTVAHLPPGSDAVTSDLAVKFLRKAPLTHPLRGEVHILRMTPRATITQASITSDAVRGGPVAHATVTYAPWMPPPAGR
jgi:acyl-coenzyme A thioesterase PaaI-like protein